MLTAVSLMFPYLFGLGCLLLLVFGSIRDEISTYDDANRLQLLACILVFGILLNHSVVLMMANLEVSLLFGCLLSTIGLVYLLILRLKRPLPVITLCSFILFIAVYVGGLLFVLVEPIQGWDARSIWFFHAKMIFYNASVDAGGDWNLPAIGFSHPDYPKMIPIIASQIAFVSGYWNEYLPKLSLVALLVPAIFCLISILMSKWWHILFVAVPLIFIQIWLKNGYMDGYLALYTGLATYFWGRWLEKMNRIDFISGILLTGVVLALKNEGMLYGLIISTLILFFGCIGRGESRRRIYLGYIEGMPLFLISVSGLLLWERKKQIFGLQNDLGLGLNSLGNIHIRLTDGSLPIVLRHLYVTDNVNLSLGVFLLSLMGTLWMGRRPTRASYFCGFAGLLYFCGIVLIYLATPYDLVGFHLPTGDRTMLPVHMILLAAAFSLCCGGNEKVGASLTGSQPRKAWENG